MAISYIGTDSISGLGYGFKNRIINGAMVIDQRNAGASVTYDGSSGYSLDRYFSAEIGNGAFTVQQVSDAPAGFTKSLKVTVTTAQTGTLNAATLQAVEGFNTADFAWGTASASPVTVSFWVKSSVTGTLGGVIQNSASNRSYPFTYAVSSAGTWEYKTVIIPGDTTGTWATDNTAGLWIRFTHGTSTTGTANTWAAADYRGPTGATWPIQTLGATWQITGVQLEKGSTATSFDYRPYGTEFALCQRYYETNCPINTAPANGIASLPSRTLMAAYATDVIATNIPFLVQKRTTPTLTFYSGSDPAGTVSGYWSYYNGSTPAWVASTNTTLGGAVPSRFDVNVSKTASFTIAATYITQGTWAASAEL